MEKCINPLIYTDLFAKYLELDESNESKQRKILVSFLLRFLAQHTLHFSIFFQKETIIFHFIFNDLILFER
jgi:hypothetical protein